LQKEYAVGAGTPKGEKCLVEGHAYSVLKTYNVDMGDGS